MMTFGSLGTLLNARDLNTRVCMRARARVYVYRIQLSPFQSSSLTDCLTATGMPSRSGRAVLAHA